MAAGPILDLDDPGVRIESNLAADTIFHELLRRLLDSEAARKCTLGRMRLLEDSLGRRTKQFRRPVESIELDKDGARFVGAVPPYRRKGACAVTTAHVSGHPDRGLETHCSVRQRSRPEIVGRVSAAKSVKSRSTVCGVSGPARSPRSPADGPL